MRTIALTMSYNEEKCRFALNEDYAQSVLQAGALPLALPVVGGEAEWAEMLARADAFIFTGGGDIAPERYGEEKLPYCDKPDLARDEQEWYLLRGALRLGKPFLAICRGMQLLNCVMGGTLYQDIAAQYSEALCHARSDKAREYVHAAKLCAGTKLRSLLGADDIMVNSRHHQGVKRLGDGLCACAIASDGLVEGIEFENGYPALGVQWHPESLADRYQEARALFAWLAESAAR